MIKILPIVECEIACPNCGAILKNTDVVWQGVHVCVNTTCETCNIHYISDLPVAHAIDSQYHINLSDGTLYGVPLRRAWFGEPLQVSLLKPSTETVQLQVYSLGKVESEVVVLNCIDYIFGHSLLKLLNASRHKNSGKSIIVIVPKSLVWLVPKYVVEIWQVDISFAESKQYFKSLDNQIRKEVKRFKHVYVSKAFGHPRYYNIEEYTGVKVQTDLQKEKTEILYIWREDRPWIGSELLVKIFTRSKIGNFLVYVQKAKVLALFYTLKRYLPKAEFCVAGLGLRCSFPNWIQDMRVDHFSPKIEMDLCKKYAQSTVVVGVLGSNMLLPSAYSTIVVDLIPGARWSNITQDVLWSDQDARVVSYKYRFLPINISIIDVARMIKETVISIAEFERTSILPYVISDAEPLHLE